MGSLRAFSANSNGAEIGAGTGVQTAADCWFKGKSNLAEAGAKQCFHCVATREHKDTLVNLAFVLCMRTRECLNTVYHFKCCVVIHNE